MNLLSLEGRTVLVTGGGQGVGRQAALHCAASGARVVVNDYYADRAGAVADEIVAAGGVGVPARCDVTDYDDVAAMVRQIDSEHGGVDILVNNAGNAGPVQDPLEPSPPFWETEPKEWDSWLGTNLHGVLHATRAALPGMVERQAGRIITVISDAARAGDANLAVYSAAKAGAAGFTRSIAKAVGRYGITANCVALSAVDTPGVASALSNPDLVKAMVRAYPLRRLGQPQDAANMILFLASDAASWITGQTYPVNGGFSFSL